MDPDVQFWGAGGFAWNERFGMANVFLAQNMVLLYAGALVPVVLVVGLTRRLLWSREIRFFTVATLLILLYAFGRHTPAFAAMYELMPGVKLFRRPADATFVFGALLAIMAGYLVHRWIVRAAGRRPHSAPDRDRHRCRRAGVHLVAFGNDDRHQARVDADHHGSLFRGGRNRHSVCRAASQ